MTSQELIVMLIVAGAGLYVLRTLFRSLRKGDCSTGCGTCVKENPPAKPREGTISLKVIKPS